MTRLSSVQPDGDNLAESFKPLLDALIGLVIVDDSPAVLGSTHGRYGWIYAPPKKGSVRIEVWSR